MFVFIYDNNHDVVKTFIETLRRKWIDSLTKDSENGL